jgi:hypothetical protein
LDKAGVCGDQAKLMAKYYHSCWKGHKDNPETAVGGF